MYLDVNAPGHRSPVAALLQGQIDYTYQNLRKLAGDMSSDELEYQGPDGTLNSTGTLIMHLANADLTWLYRLQGMTPPLEVRARFGPARQPGKRLPEIHGYSAAQLLDLYGEVQAQLQQYTRTLTDEDLAQVVWRTDEYEATARWGLWHIAEHSNFHQGHIIWLKAWVRRGPGD